MRASNEGSRVPEQDRASIAFKRDDEKDHYVLVDKMDPRGPQYAEQQHEFIHGRKNGINYRIASDDPNVTGHSGTLLLACDKKEWDDHEATRVAMGNAAMKQKANLAIPGYMPDFDKTEYGESDSLEDLAKGLPEG